MQHDRLYRYKEITCFMALIVLVAGLAQAQAVDSDAPGAKAFVKGQTLLKQSDFEGALKSFTEAARADTANLTYRDAYGILRRVVRMRSALTQEANPKKWEKTASALRNYYYANQLQNEALLIDRQAYERNKTPETAAHLAESLIALGKDGEAEKVLRGADVALSPQGQIWLGISLAHQEKIDEAKAVNATIELPEAAGPEVLLTYARLQALLDESRAALDNLAKALESTPPSRIDALREQVGQTADFKQLATSQQTAEDFKTALETESKIKESSCSGGTSCGSCSKKSGCGEKSGSSAKSCDSKCPEEK